MVSTRGKKKTESSNMTLEENKTAENAPGETQASDSLTEEPKANAQFEGNVEIQGIGAGNDKYEEKSDEEESEFFLTEVDNNDETTIVTEVENDDGETIVTEVDNNDEKAIVTEVENDDEKVIVTEMNGDSEAEVEENTYEDDEIDDQENVMWEDDEESSEEDNEEDFVDEDEGSEEEIREEEEEEEEEDEVSEEEATEEDVHAGDTQEVKEIAKRDGKEAEAKENGREAAKHNTEKVEVSLKNIKKSSQRNKKKKLGAERSKKVDLVDKPESSCKRKAKKRVESMGMIFMCSSKTKNDCYQYRVLGLPESKKDTVEKIYKGMRLFLYDVDLKLMYGIYKAVGPGGYNIEPKAFKSQFPSQVRFTVLDDCLPLAEEKFKKVIKDNYYTKTKFDCLLNSEQVKKLCKLFVSSSKGQGSKKLGRTRKVVEKRPIRPVRPIRQERTRSQRASDNKRRLPLREDPRNRERPHKRQRKIVSPVAPLHRHLPPLPPPTFQSYAYERTSDVDAYRQDPYLETHSPYRDNRRDPPLTRRGDTHRDGRDPYPECVRDPYLDRRDPYRDGRDPYLERRDPYRDGRDTYLKRRDPYRDGRDTYLERRDPYREGRDMYLERRDSYRDSYMEVRGSEPHSTGYRSLEPLADRRGVYRDSYRRDELLESREVNPIILGTRNRDDDVGTRDSYLSYRERPLYAEPIYSDDYPSRAGLARQYRL